MKPKTWKELPYCIRVTFVESIDCFDYDPYESSRDEVIAEILGGYHCNDTNLRALSKIYAALAEEQFAKMVKDHMGSLSAQLEELKTLL